MKKKDELLKMKEINVYVKVEYLVSLKTKVSDEIFDALIEDYENSVSIDPQAISTPSSEWIVDNIKEEDSHNWEYEIHSLEENK